MIGAEAVYAMLVRSGGVCSAVEIHRAGLTRYVRHLVTRGVANWCNRGRDGIARSVTLTIVHPAVAQAIRELAECQGRKDAGAL